jgi:hypothetical protein
MREFIGRMADRAGDQPVVGIEIARATHIDDERRSATAQ